MVTVCPYNTSTSPPPPQPGLYPWHLNFPPLYTAKYPYNLGMKVYECPCNITISHMTCLCVISHACVSYDMLVCHMSLLFVILHFCNVSWTLITHSSRFQLMFLLCVCTFVVIVQEISFQFVD